VTGILKYLHTRSLMKSKQLSKYQATRHCAQSDCKRQRKETREACEAAVNISPFCHGCLFQVENPFVIDNESHNLEARVIFPNIPQSSCQAKKNFIYRPISTKIQAIDSVSKILDTVEALIDPYILRC